MDRTRVQALFAQALEIEPEQIGAWLDGVCGEDMALRHAIERLLRADASARDFMEQPPALLAESLADSAADPARERPAAFGPYRVVDAIGVGGMGEVWLAERSDGEFEQRVAIKQIAYPTPGLLQRFRQERQILARLEHPNIARLLDGGVDERGVPYLVMEYIEGERIDAYVRRASLDIGARLRLFLEICAAVQYAHQNLVIHRDIKPSNIVVGADGVPKLLDFGVAKVLATTDGVEATQTAARMLTPDYAAPEQFTGGAITTATDVYALGVVLYELLTGARPRRPLQPAIAGADFPPPSAIAGGDRTMRRALRGDVDRIVATALAHDPLRRYASVEALAADIRRHLEGQPISVRGDAWYHFGKFARRHRYALAGSVLVVAVCIAAALISLEQARRARAEAARADAVRRFLVGVFRQASPDENRGQPLSAEALLQKGEQQIGKLAEPGLAADVTALLGELFIDVGDFESAAKLLDRLPGDDALARLPDDVRARVLVERAVIEDENNRFDDAAAHARQGLALLESARHPDAAAIAYARYNLAHSMNVSGHHAEVETMLRAALPREGSPVGGADEGIAGEWEQLGVALGKLGRPDEAAAAFAKSIAANTALYGENSQHVANLYNDLGNMYDFNGDRAKAEAAFRRSVAIYVAAMGPDHHDTLVAQSNLLAIIEHRGRFDEAIRERLALIEHMERTASFPPLSIANARYLLGKDYREQSRFDESEAALRKALGVFVSSQGPRSLRNAPLLRNLGTLLVLEGHYDEAEETLRNALAIVLEHDAPGTPAANLLHADVGHVLRMRHRGADALAELGVALDGYAKAGKTADPSWPMALAELGEARLDAGDANAANDAATEALARARKALPDGGFEVGAPLFALGRARLALGRADEAEPLLREALAVRNPPHATSDPRVVEVKVTLAATLVALGRRDEASALAAEVEPLLAASSNPYAADLRARLAKAH